MSPRPRLAAIAAFLAAAIAIEDARADDAPSPAPNAVQVDLDRLGTELDHFAREAERTRWANAVTALGLGAALLPSGIILLHRTDGISRALVLGMVIGGSTQLVSIPFAFLPTRMEEIHDKFVSRPRLLDSEQTVHVLEHDWERAADAAHDQRKVVGTVLTVTGLAALGTGLTFLIAHAGIFGMSRATQYTVGGVLTGMATPLVTYGVRFLVEWSPEELAWDVYRTRKPDAGKVDPTKPTLAIAPLDHGFFAATRVDF